MTRTLPDAPWRHRPGLDRLLDAIGVADGCARFVGGAVRDTLLRHEVNDVDVATTLTPAEVIERLGRAGIKAVPTGIAHGTITAVLDGWPVEVTTLRRDVSTDGRRATVAYSTDWREDAARRDFTINALFADPLTGKISDFFGGLDDLEARQVRFIGRAEDRIVEDHLRILRYFRFLARFGHGEADAEAYGACVARASSLMALSRERIADELLKLLAVGDPVPAVRLMVDGGILRSVVPEIGADGVERLAALVPREAAAEETPAPLRRLAALLPRDPAVGEAVGARLKLSNKARKRIALALADEPGGTSHEELAYRIGVQGAVDRMLLSADVRPADIARMAQWESPRFSMRGGDLIALGIEAGPDVARALRALEEQWIAEGFPNRDRLDEIAAQIVSKFQRARQ